MTTIAQRLAALNTQRGQHIAAYEAAVQTALDENRDLTAEENTTVTDLRSQIEQADTQIRTWTEHETALARQAQPVPRTGTALTLRTQRERPVIEMQRRNDYPAMGFTRMAIAIAVAGYWNAAEYARVRWEDDQLADGIEAAAKSWMLGRAAVPPVGGGGFGIGGAPLTWVEHMGQEFIELLRPQLITGRVPSMRRLNFNGAGMLEIPRQTGTVAGGYIGEGGQIRVQRPDFGTLPLVPSKLAVIVPSTNEIMRRSDPALEMIIRDDIVEGTSRTVDTRFFSTIAGGAGPAGILNLRPEFVPGQINDSDDPNAVAGDPPSVGQVTTALKNMIYELRRNDVQMTAPVWIMNVRLREFLRLQRTAQTEIFAWKAEIDAGTLLGYPIVDSTNVPINTAAGTPWPGVAGRSAYALIDGSQVIWADDMAPIIDASTEASIVSDDWLPSGNPPGNPPGTPPPPSTGPFWSAFQNDMILMRLRTSHTWARRHDVAIVWSTTAW